MTPSGGRLGRDGELLGMLQSQDAEEARALDRPHIWEASSNFGEPANLLPLGRIFGILFAAETAQVERAVTQDKGSLPQQQKGQVGTALYSLDQLVKHMVAEGSPLHQVAIPILDHAVKSKNLNYRKKSFLLLRWLLQSDVFGVAVAKTLASVIGGRGQKPIKLGWCLLVRETLQTWAGQNGNLDSHGSIGKNLDIFSACIPSLLDVLCEATVFEDATKIPTRLAIAAADCLLMITKCLTTNPLSQSQADSSTQRDMEREREKVVLITPLGSGVEHSRDSDLLQGFDDEPPCSSSSSSDPRRNREAVLWDQLDNLIAFIKEMREWNDKERPLFATGLGWLHNRLLSLASYRDAITVFDKSQCDGELLVGAAVLAACWEHFAVLLVTQDKKLSLSPQPVLFHWLGALQFYSTEMADSGVDEGSKRAQEMRAYALACLTLIVGRLDAHHLESVLDECEADLLKAMFDQIRDADSSIEDLAVALIRAVLFRRSPTDDVSLATSGRMESVVPMLLDMLDARDVAAKAVVLLVAEFFAANPESAQLEQLFSRLDSEEAGQRRNALDVLTELFSICTKSEGNVTLTCSHLIATHLFKRLGDSELSNRKEVPALFANLDPSFTLPKLLEALYSTDGRERSASRVSILSVLKDQRDQSGRVVQLLDCTTDLLKSFEQDNTGKKAGGRRKDIDRVMHLLPDWASCVKDWEIIVPVVLEKMFREPENAVIPRFLSSISVQLAEWARLLLPLVLDEMRGRARLTQDPLELVLSNGDRKERAGMPSGEIFQRLSPLLVLRILPLIVFSDPLCRELYGNGEDDKSEDTSVCITRLLLNRMCGAFEYDEVRKVASELLGRLFPEIMMPLVTAKLREAVQNQDVLKVKACLYAVCVSLGARGHESLSHPSMSQIRQLLTSILVWPTAAGGKTSLDVGKAQHGCIDSLAMMVCAEIQQRMPIDSTSANLQKSSTEEQEASLKSSLRDVEDSILKEKETMDSTHLESKTAEIRFATVLPESEQLKSRLMEDKKSPLDVPTTAATHFKHKRLEGERQPRLIEEVDDRPLQVCESDGNGMESGVHQTVLLSVISCLTCTSELLPWQTDSNTQLLSQVVPLSFRLCMANVLISACQKVAAAARDALASRLIPTLVFFVQTSPDSKLRGACIQVLFTAVYHLKAPAILPYGVELFSLAIAAIRSRGLQDERLAGAKLLASLLASEEVLVKDLAPYFEDAQAALSSIALMDSSPELRMVCEKLLSCMLPPSD